MKLIAQILAELTLLINNYFNGEIKKEIQEYEKRNKLTPKRDRLW